MPVEEARRVEDRLWADIFSSEEQSAINTELYESARYDGQAVS